MFRAVSVFPGPFTLEAAEAVAGPGAGAVVLRLVDCSLLVPPREGPDGRWRYCDAGDAARLRGRAAGRVRGAGRGRAAALAGWAVEVAGQAAAGLRTVEGEAAAARWLDAEDATMAQVLAWAMEHDRRPGAAAGGRRWAGGGTCGAGWRASSQLLREAAGRAVPGSDGWCAAQFLAGLHGAGSAVIRPRRWVISPRCGTRPRSGGRARRWPTALAGRAGALAHMGRYAEAAEDARRCPRGGPRDRLPAGGGASPGRPGHRRLVCRRSGRCRAAGPAGRADHRRSPRRR